MPPTQDELNEAEIYQWVALGMLLASPATHKLLDAADFSEKRVADMAAEIMTLGINREAPTPLLDRWLARPEVDSQGSRSEILARIVRSQCVAQQMSELLGKLRFGLVAKPGVAINTLRAVVARSETLLEKLK